MVSETVFKQLVCDLAQTNTAKHTEFWKHVTSIASNESKLREQLETALQSKDFIKHFKNDITSSDLELRCAVVLAIGYCVARPNLARHLDLKTIVDHMVKATRLSSYHKQIAIKSVWAVANVKEADTLKDLAEDVLALICDIVKHKFLKDDVTVHKEILRLLEKMLLTAPKTCCKFTYLARWLICVVNLTVSKLQVIREKAEGLLEKHMTTLLSESDNEVNRIVGQQLFSLSTVSNIAKPTSWLLQELQQLANTGHSVYVIRVWVSFVHMTSKFILKKAAYLNELFSVPDFFTKHLTDDISRIALFDSWIEVIDIYRSNIPEFFANSKHMKFFMTPFFAIKQPSLDVSLALIKSWWYLVVACHRLKYMNNFTAVLEPCIKTCFKHQEASALVQRGADILYLLLDRTPPGCELATIAPSSLNLSETFHCTTFFKYYEMLIRYKPNCKGLIIPIWSRLCDCTKGVPDARSMISVLQTASTNLSHINVLSMIESVCQSPILSTLNKAYIAQFVLQCANKDDKLLSIHLTKLLKSVSFEDNQYLKFLSEILSLIPEKSDKEELRVLSKVVVWESVSSALAEFAEQTGGALNEGTRIKPEFSTTHSTVTFVFKLFHKSHHISQSSIQSVCEKWERLVSLYIEHTSQYCAVNVTEQLVSHILDTYLDIIQLYPLIYCSKVLVEESPVPQLSLLQSNSSPVFKLVSNVLNLAYNENKSNDLPPPTLFLCVELCTSSWNLLTPGRVISTLTEIRECYLGILSQDKQYPTSLQNTVQASYTSLLNSIQKHLTFYNGPELECLEDYIIYGLKHSKRLVRVTTAKFWNSSFGIKHSGPYSDKLRAVLQQEAKRSALIVPSGAKLSIERSHSQSTEMSDPRSKTAEVPVRGSFLNRKTDIRMEVEDPKPSPKKTETFAKSSKKAVTKPRPATPPRTRSVHKRQVAEESQDCIYISTSPKKQKILTKHQKEKRIEQRVDRDVPVMYNSLDLNSQEPFLFDNNSQSQALPSGPPSPEKAPDPPSKTTSPGFSSKRMLFLSPVPNKATSSQANQSIIPKILSSIPLTSPDPPSSQSQQNNSPSDSEEDLYCDPPEGPTSAPPVEPLEPAITPPNSVRELPDSGIEHSQLPTSPELPGNESFTPEDSSGKVGMISNAIKSMISYVVPRMGKPSSLTIPLSSDNEKSDENRSQSSATTPSEPKTSTDTTPIDSKTSSNTSPNGSETSVKSTPLVPPESLIESVLETPADTSRVLVEDSQQVTPDIPLIAAVTAVPDSIPPESSAKQAETTEEVNETAPDLQQFSHDISLSDCSTARDAALKKFTEKVTEPAAERRSSRRLTKRIKSEDLGFGAKELSVKFKRVKSFDDFPEIVSDAAKVMTPIRESDELAQLRKSVRPRKSSAKLRDDSFITTNVPASILNSQPQGETCKEPENRNVTSTPGQKATVTKGAANAVKKKRGRPRKTLSQDVSSQESPRKKVSNQEKDLGLTKDNIPLVTISDSQSENDSADSSQNSVVCIGEVAIADKIRQKNTIIPDTPVLETPPTLPKSTEMTANKKSDSLTQEIRVTDSQSSQISPGDTTVKSIPDSQAGDLAARTSIPDSQPTPTTLQMEPVSSSQPRKKRGRPPKKSKNVTDVSDSVMIPSTPTASQSKSRKSARLSTTPPDSKNLITAYMSKSSKPSKKVANDSDDTLPPVVPSGNIVELVKIESSTTEEESSVESKNSSSQEVEKKIPETVPQTLQNDSESLTQSLAPEFQLTEEDDSLSLQLLPLPTPSQDSISPQETESVPSSSSPRRPRKQSKPKKSVAPVRSRKSLRLTAKSLAAGSQGDSIGELMKDSPVIDIHSQVRVADSLQPNLEANSMESTMSAASEHPTQTNSSETKLPPKEIENDTEPLSQILSLDVSSSDKANLFSPEKELLELSTPQKTVINNLQSPGYNSSPASVASVETFGKPISELKFDSLPCSPHPGLDTLEDSANDQHEQLVQESLPEPVSDTLEVPVEDTLPESVGDTSAEMIAEALQDSEKDTLPESDMKPDTGKVPEIRETSPESLTPPKKEEEVPVEVMKLASPYRELEEFPDTETSVTFCPNSQIPASQEEEEMLVTECSVVSSVVPDSQVVRENPTIIVEDRTTRSLKRKPSIPSNLPDVMQDLVAVELSIAEKMEVEAKTPPKSLQLGVVGEPNTPTTPKTPSSILKKNNEPGSGSPSLSKRHVTFGPLPEPHRDPNEVTPRRHSKYRKSPAPPQPKIRHPEPVNSEDSVYPSLVHSTVRAHDIVRTLCTGFTLSQRNYNLSIVSSTIKTIGDLARLTPAQIEEYPFITPKLIQVRRNLKKFEASQSPMFSVKSFLSETRARELSQKSEPETLETVLEATAGATKESSQTNNDKTSETQEIEAQEEKENVAESSGKKEEDSELITTELEDENKENKDPNDKPVWEDSEKPAKTVEVIEIPSTQETVVSDVEPMEIADLQSESLFNINSALPTTDVLSSQTMEDQVAVVQNSVSTVATTRGSDEEVIVVGRSETNLQESVETPEYSEKFGEGLSPGSGLIKQSDAAYIKGETPEPKVSSVAPETDPEIEISDKIISPVKESEATDKVVVPEEQSSGSLESNTGAVICEDTDSPEDSLGLTCHEELSLSLERNKNTPTIIPDTYSESSSNTAETNSESSSISQDIAKTITEATREGEMKLQGQIVESQDQRLDLDSDFKVSSTDSDGTDNSADQKPLFKDSSISSLIRDIPGFAPIANTSPDKAPAPDSKPSEHDVIMSGDATTVGEITNPLVDYPLTQPQPLVDYPLTQDLNSISFEEEISRIEEKLSLISDPARRHLEHLKIIERISRIGRNNS